MFRIHVALAIELHDLAPPASVRWRAHGVAPGSTLEVNTTVNLEAQGGGHTHLAWRSAITAHGMIARLRRGLVEETLRQFTDRFWHNIADRLATLLSGAGRLLLNNCSITAERPWRGVSAPLLPPRYCRRHRPTRPLGALFAVCGSGFTACVSRLIGSDELQEMMPPAWQGRRRGTSEARQSRGIGRFIAESSAWPRALVRITLDPLEC
jgi:hypothetical protein